MSTPPTHYVREFRLEDGLPVWRYEAEGFIIEKRLLLIHGQNTLHVTYRLLSGQDSARLELRPSVHFRPHENDVGEPLGEGYALLIREHRYEISAPELPHPLRLTMHGEHAHFTHEGGRLAGDRLSDRGRSRLPFARRVVESRFFHSSCGPNRPATLVASTEDWPSILALDPDTAHASALERRQRLLAAAHPSARSGPAGGTRARRRSIHHHARRAASRTPRAPSRGRRSAHGHRGLPLVHRLGPRHDDQPRRADAHDGPASRGRLDSPHLRPLHPRRPDPEYVSRRRSARASTTRRTRRSGSSTRSIATSR